MGMRFFPRVVIIWDMLAQKLLDSLETCFVLAKRSSIYEFNLEYVGTLEF